MKFYSYKKGGRAGNVLAMLKGECTTSFGVVLTWEFQVLAILKWGGDGGVAKSVHSF